MDACPSCQAYHQHLIRCWEVSDVYENLEPRPELSARIRSRVRELSAREEVRVVRPTVVMNLRRFFAPLAYATAGATLAATLFVGRVGMVAGNTAPEPSRTSIVSAQEYDIPKTMRPGEVTPVLIIPEAMPKSLTQEVVDSDYAMGLESPSEAHLVNFTQ